MAESDVDRLKEQVLSLQEEVAARESDLAHFRKQLAAANQRLEGLIAQLQSELKIAHRVQKALVSTEYPNIPGFEFSSKFVSSMVSGGDYFDIFEHEDRFRFGVIVASSTGHSMSALLLSVLLRMTGQMEARRGAPPEQVMQSLVQDLLKDVPDNDLADVFYGVIDRRNYEMSYCSLGDVTAVHRRYNQSEISPLSSCGEAIARNFDSSSLQSHSISLNPKDQLVFCTKGVVETSDLSGEQFGRERLYKAIYSAPKQGVHELRNEILFRAHRHGGGQEPKHDQTVVVLEVKDRVIKLAKK